jgi:hypothetical protein
LDLLADEYLMLMSDDSSEDNDSNLFHDRPEDHNGDGSLTDDYLNSVRKQLTRLGKASSRNDKIKLLNMATGWRRSLDDLGLDDSDDVRAVAVRTMSMILGDTDATANEIRDYVASLIMSLTLTKIKPNAKLD